jgi:acetyl esterase/lipase
MLKAAVDWAVQQHGSPESPFANRLDVGHIVSMGHSCGGGLAVQLATEDSRVTGLGVWFSGAGLGGAQGNDPASLQKTKGPIIIITGDAQQDTAHARGKATFEAFTHVPAFYGWQDGLQHIGTFGAKNGGEIGTIARNWLEWTTRSDATAGRMFKGSGCTLCADPAWHITKRGID